MKYDCLQCKNSQQKLETVLEAYLRNLNKPYIVGVCNIGERSAYMFTSTQAI